GTCTQWDINGQWRMVQSNTKYAVRFTLEKTQDGIEGSARYLYKIEGSGPTGSTLYITNVGSVDGTIDGNSLELTVYWEDRKTGIYKGTFTGQGRLQGSSYQKEDPRNRADWYSERRANCLAREGA